MTRQAILTHHPKTDLSLPTGIMQRKCVSCGKSTIAGATCNTCQQQKNSRHGPSKDGKKPEGYPSSNSQLLPAVAFTAQTVQPKLKIGAPNDRFEQEADQIADQVIQMPELGPAAQRPMNLLHMSSTQRVCPKDVCGKAHIVSTAISNQVNNAIKGISHPLPSTTQNFFQPRFGQNFSHIKVHTDAQAAESAKALNARAYTVGQHIVFGPGEYAPETIAGKRLLAHELVHTLQQGAVQAKTIQATSDNIIQLRTDLGFHSWTSTFMGRRTIHRDVIALTRQEWEARLRNLDEESEYREVQGFLECAVNPSIADQTSHPNGWPNYVNNIRRAPNREEILNFMRALYSVGSDLDLPDGGWGDDGGPFRLGLRNHIATLISRYQGFIIREFSEQGNVIPEANVAAIVDETNADYVFSRRVMTGIINNAGATAMKALDMAVTASNYSNQARRENSLATAYEMVRNAGRTIRYAITQESVQIQYNQSVVSNVFDTVWGTLPGGGALAGVAKDLLKLGLKTMIEEASKQDGSTAQAEELNNNFVRYANQLVRDGHTTSDIIQPAINGFEAVRR